MVDFGFGLVPSSRINLDLFDREKFEALAALEPDVRKCMACGSCAAVCTAGKFVRTSVREAVEELFNAHPDRALDLLKSCQLCGKCTMVCPRGINTPHHILSLAKIFRTK